MEGRIEVPTDRPDDMARPWVDPHAAHKTLAVAVTLLVVGCSAQVPDADTMDGAPRSSVPEALSTYEPRPTQRDEVVATLQSVFDALESGDEALLRSVVDPSVVMHFTENRDGTTTFGSADLDGLATRITTSEVPLIERMWDPVVVVDGALATIWTPYDFYAGEEFSHCGVDSANLLRTDDGWRIVALSWTRHQPPACELHPEGPPTG